MNTMMSSRVTYEDLRELNFADIGDSYVAVGVPFENPCYQFLLHNNTDIPLRISFNGISDKAWTAAKQSRVLDYGSNKTNIAKQAAQPQGTVVYVKSADGTTATEGDVFIECIYFSTF